MSAKLESWPSQMFEFTLPMRYHLERGEGKGLVIAMHGYQDHALSMMKRIGWWERQDLSFQVLAINGPFPVPIWTKSGFLEAYAWYFRDTERGFTIVSPQQMAARIAELIAQLNLQAQPTMLFGFSQGAYLAPFVAAHIKDLRGIIGLGSGYPIEPYSTLKKTKVFALHGDQDKTIPIAASQAAHAELLRQGFGGEFFTIPGLEHKVETRVEPMIRALVEENLK